MGVLYKCQYYYYCQNMFEVGFLGPELAVGIVAKIVRCYAGSVAETAS